MIKRAIITGASSGIGEGFARELHRRGAEVLLVARREERLRAICEKLNSSRVDSASFKICDLCDEAQLAELVEVLRRDSFDCLVSNAGRGSFGYYDKLDIEEELAMMQLNTLAPMRLYHAALSSFRERSLQPASIISVSSIAGFQPLPLMATYAASKAVNYSHGIALHYEAKEFGCRFLTVCPGPVETEFAGVARVPGEFTGLPREPVETVVNESLSALEKGKAFVIPGLRAKFLSAPSRVLPVAFNTWMSGLVLKRVLRKSGLL